MSSAARIRVGGGSGKKSTRPNPVRRIMEREQRIRENSVASSASNSTPTPAAPSGRPQCKNPHCTGSDVRDGHCQNCGFVVFESNIVAEITFGESSNGAAVVHGSYLAADQGGIRPTAGGLAFRRVAGAGASEARERSLREAKQLMSQFAYQLQIPPHVADKAYQLYKFASNSNFIQGRRKTNVAAICVYAACRKEENNKVMLIDLADIIKTDVFLLGRSYKELLALLPDVKEGTKPVIIEDLIFRFASKLEFLHDTNKVALSAIRIAQRMRHDNITHGRRPAGICGSALIMAARAHNYRRTVREVVYIAKVTMATLQERMEDDQAAQTTQAENVGLATPASSESPVLPAENSQTPIIDKDGFVVPPRPGPMVHERSIVESAANNVDDQLEALADEFGDVEEEESEEEFDPSSEMAMAAAQGIQVPGLKMKIKPRQGPSPAPAENISRGVADDNGVAARPDNSAPNMEKPTLRIDEEWELDETNLEKEMQGHLNDPAMIGASALVTKFVEIQREQESAARAANSSAGTLPASEGNDNAPEPNSQPMPDMSRPCFTPTSKISDDPIIHEDEFKDDPEVMFCKLSERDVQLKEMIWANHNKDYMRKVQQKIFDAKLAQNGPPKQKRNRAKKPRIGEGQAGPAGSAEEAAQNMLRARAISTKLDYTRMGNLFEFSKGGPGSTYGGTSSVGSRTALPSSAGSDADSDKEDDDDDSQPPAAAAAPENGTPAPSAAPAAAAGALAPPADGEGEEEEEEEKEEDNAAGGFGAEDDYQEEETFAEEDFDPFGDANGGDEYDE
ncbi:hypothetical protein BT67DRAFT_379657 [Trichocladium antarcticum]|uniref:Cyclin-like domain-containing protein n=1 Tax=Trichocladium antarcticum TaxID=1450529 RepID=A0AAN6UKH5_9PEZI|nr:hypothetical protein BT67DRAFT_379657 [Trichocladium antarcticum]